MSASEFLPYGRQHIDEDDIQAVLQVLRSDFLTTGPAVDEFEARLADAVDAPFAVVCSSGTAALHLACLALEAGPNDTGIVPAITFVATANALRYCDAEVCFADVDAESGLAGPVEFEAALEGGVEPEPRILLPVHLNGQCPDLEGIWELAHSRGLRVIEDACHALGAEYTTRNGKRHKIGASEHSDMTMFSFHPVKAIAAGEGGAITTRDRFLYERLKQLRNHGLVRDPAHFEASSFGSTLRGDAPPPWYYELQEPGYNYRLSDIHAALGTSQLKKLPQFVEKRRALAATYDALLAPLAPLIRPVATVRNCSSAYHLYAVLIDFEEAAVDRTTLVMQLREHGIGTQVHFPPVSMQPYYQARYGKPGLEHAWQYYQQVLSLPLCVDMSNDDVEYVVKALAAACGLNL